LLGAVLIRSPALSKSEKWTIFIVLAMLSFFVTGLFYDANRNASDEELEEFEDFLQSAGKFGWTDFLIIFYSVLIVITAAQLFKFLFIKSTISPLASIDVILKKTRFVRIKRIVGYALAWLIMIASCWCCFTFSLSFGYNTTNKWIFAFGVH
jgi:hypothetical protein